KHACVEYINPILSCSEADVVYFSVDVFDRVRNAFIKHLLSSIALNSISKFKVRVLPSLLDYQDKFGKLPLHLTFSFACLIRFYKGDWKGTVLPVQDDAQVVDFFKTLWRTNDYATISERTLSHLEFWDEDLTQVPELSQHVAKALECIDAFGIAEGLNKFSEDSKVVG